MVNVASTLLDHIYHAWTAEWYWTPLEIVFQEQSYSVSIQDGVLHGNFHDVIGDPCGTIADPCGVIANPCGDWRLPIVALLTKHCETPVQQHETLVKHRETRQTLAIRCNDIDAQCGVPALGARCGVPANIGDCSVGITSQMCNRAGMVNQVWKKYSYLDD